MFKKSKEMRMGGINGLTRPINKKARPSGREEPGRPQVKERYEKSIAIY